MRPPRRESGADVDHRKANLGLDPAGALEVESADRLVVKLLRALGGCLGVRRRRRTWLAAISYGEPQAGVDP